MGKNLKALPIAVQIVLLLASGGQATPRFEPQSSNEEVRQLLTVVRDEQLLQQAPDLVAKTIERLGEIKSIEAIDDLIRLLTFRRTFDWEDTHKKHGMIEQPHYISDLSRYPAAGALFQIGMPALPLLVKVIENEEAGSLASDNAISTVTTIFRGDPSAGVEYLRRGAAESSSSSASQRLFKAAETLKRFYDR